MLERTFVRVLVASVLSLALLAFALTPVPAKLPTPAFEQTCLYRLEVALLVFYGVLLLATPVFSGLIRGRLPIEISTRGAKFASETDQAADRDEAAIRELERSFDNLADVLAKVRVDVEQLKFAGDNT
jgi:hypothetical protein